MSPTATVDSVRTFRTEREFTSPKVKVRNSDGTPAGEIELDGSLFGIVPNKSVLHQVITAHLAAKRAGTHSTLRRSEVRGGGRKPWRQKGTGRARQGSIRAAQWIGGGIAMGPKPRDYSQSTPKKMVRLALASALSDRVSSERLTVVSEWGFSGPRTKEAVAALAALEISGKALIVLDRSDYDAYLSFSNIPTARVVPSDELTAYDIIWSDWVVFTKEALSMGGNSVTITEATEEAKSEPAKEAKAKAAKASMETESAETVSAADDEGAEEEGN